MNFWHFCFRVSGVSYLFFLMADYLRPGFISSVMSVHWWVIPLLVSYLGLVIFPAGAKVALSRFGALLLAALFGMIVLRERLIFGDLFILIFIAAVSLPFFLRHSLNKLAD